MKYNVLQYLEDSAAQFGEKIVFADEKESITYQELLCNAQSVGTYLLHNKVKKGAVAVIMRKCPSCFSAYFGAVYAGLFYVPIDDRMPIERVRLIFETLKPAYVIYDSANAANVEQIAPDCPSAQIDTVVSAMADVDMLVSIREKAISTDPVYALFTSGSTGTPKGVVVNHSSIIAYTEWLANTFHYDDATIFGNQTPFYFSMSVHDIYSTIRNGCTMEIIPKKYFSFPGRLSEYLCQRKVNTIYWVPTALCLVANTDAFSKREIPPLKKILFAGEVMPTKQLNYWISKIPEAMFTNLFGPTEITDIGLYYIVDRSFSDDEPLPIGKPCQNCGCLVLTDDLREARAGEEGELCIRGAFLAMGYYNDWERTSSAFVQNPLNKHYPEMIYKTGDLVKCNERGEYIFVGRKDFQIKHMGYRIELGEIETILGSVEGVTKVCCIYDKINDHIVCYYTGSIESRDLMAVAGKRLPSYMVPSHYINLPVLPINPNGKIDRKKLTHEHIEKN